MQPMHRRETSRPVLPNFTYSIASPLVVAGSCRGPVRRGAYRSLPASPVRWRDRPHQNFVDIGVAQCVCEIAMQPSRAHLLVYSNVDDMVARRRPARANRMGFLHELFGGF